MQGKTDMLYLGPYFGTANSHGRVGEQAGGHIEKSLTLTLTLTLTWWLYEKRENCKTGRRYTTFCRTEVWTTEHIGYRPMDEMSFSEIPAKCMTEPWGADFLLLDTGVLPIDTRAEQNVTDSRSLSLDLFDWSLSAASDTWDLWSERLIGPPFVSDSTARISSQISNLPRRTESRDISPLTLLHRHGILPEMWSKLKTIIGVTTCSVLTVWRSRSVEPFYPSFL